MADHRRSPLTTPQQDAASCTHDVRQRVLAHVPFFAELSPAAIESIDRRCRVEDFEAGDPVHLAGAPARLLHIVATGSAKRTRPTLDGDEVLLDVLRPGDHFGAVPALGAEVYADSVWALTHLCVLSLDVDTVDEILDEHPGVARAALSVLAGQLEAAMAHIHRMSAATAEQRVAAVLLTLAERTGRPHRGGGTLLDVPLSRDDLGSMTGTASETVSRILAQLRRDGVVETGRRWVAVRDLDALRELATF